MLAALTHPGIVRLLGGGLWGARPYLVMELVDGEAITTYCDRRQLTVTERLRLFEAVCDAVQSAHRQLIVHLDLKPSNVLVTTEGRVKLLDFGTAKLMDETGALTATTQLTPLYASPERLRRGDVSVASDVYSLGLVLFEVLTGAWPFASRDSILAVAERAAGHATRLEPAAVITAEAAEVRKTSVQRLRARLQGDLAAICAKALAHEPDARYASVEQMASDIAAHLDGRPVMVRGQSRTYRAGRFLRRHWLASSAALLVVATLTAATAYAIGQRNAARVEAARARAASGFLMDALGSVQWTSLGRKTTLEEFNYQALDQLNRSVADGRVPPEMEAPVRVALANSFTSNTDVKSATDQIDRLFDLARVTKSARTRVLALSAQSELLFIQGKLAAALPPAREAFDIARRRFSDAADLMLAATEALAVRLQFVAGPTPEALALHREAVRMARAATPPDQVQLVNVLSRACGAIVEVTPDEGRPLCADALASSALPLQGSLHNVYLALGNEASNRGDWKSALAYRHKDLDVVTATASTTSLVPLVSSLLAWAEWMSGEDRAQALARAEDGARRLFNAAPDSAWNYTSYIIYAHLLNESGDGAAAEPWARRAIQVSGYDVNRDPRSLAGHAVLGASLLRQGRFDDALSEAERGLAIPANGAGTKALKDSLGVIRLAAAAPSRGK